MASPNSLSQSEINDIEEEAKIRFEKEDRTRFTRSIVYYDFFDEEMFNMIWNPYVPSAKKNLCTIYNLYISGLYLPPIAFNKKSNKGIIATKKIEENVLICEFACDLLPDRVLKTKNKRHNLFEGPTSESSLSFCLHNFRGFGTEIRESEVGNASIFKVMIDGVLRSIVHSNKIIESGQEILIGI